MQLCEGKEQSQSERYAPNFGGKQIQVSKALVRHNSH